MAIPQTRQARLEDPVGLSPADRAARGKAARRAVPREAHASFHSRPDRPDPVELLKQQGAARIDDLLHIRYGRMLASPLAYFRGAALPMAADLSCTPVTGLTTQLCGDAHLCNFGIFASPERRLVFDINDFDETLPGPWEWDVKRLAASLEIAGRCNGFTTRQRRHVTSQAARHYRLTMRTLAGLGNLEVWYSHLEVDELADRYRALLTEHELELAGADLSGANVPRAVGDEPAELAKLVAATRGGPKLVASPPLLVPAVDLPDPDVALAYLTQIITGYRQSLELDRRYLVSQFEIADVGRKVVGVGSVGLRCWMVVLTGKDDSDWLFLQVKEAQPSVLSQFTSPSPFPNQGQRVVAGQRLMQAASDMFLGWHRSAPAPRTRSGRAGAGRPSQYSRADYYIRQLRDWKFSLPTEQMRPTMMRAYAALCGRTLARAHARSGDRIAIATYLGAAPSFETAIAEFADHYANQNERDYAQLKAAVKAGSLPAERDV